MIYLDAECCTTFTTPCHSAEVVWKVTKGTPTFTLIIERGKRCVDVFARVSEEGSARERRETQRGGK